jgi:galactokinase
LRRDRDIAMPHGWTFAIATTGVEARKSEEAREAFNRLADPARMTGARREHFLAEDARVPLAADAFARADARAIRELAAESQADAERLLGNQVPQTRALVDFAREHGAIAASGFGAGWGGSVWALVETEQAARFVARWLGAYRRVHPQLMTEAFVSAPAEGLRRVVTE